MDEHVYKKIELTGSSKSSTDDAIQNAIDHASKTIPNMRCGAFPGQCLNLRDHYTTGRNGINVKH